MKIEKLSLYRLRIPLKQPYKIATAVMKAFDCTNVSVQSRGHEGLGEAMADIQGYFWETADQVWRFAKDQGPKVLGLPLEKAKESLLRYVEKSPCAATPFLTALEMLDSKSLLAPPSQILWVPMLGIVQATDPGGIRDESKISFLRGMTPLRSRSALRWTRILKG